MILAIDIGTKMGFAGTCNFDRMKQSRLVCKTYKQKNLDKYFPLMHKDSCLICGCKKLIKNKQTIRTEQMYKFIESINNVEIIDTIVYEKVYRHTGSHASHLFGAYENVLVKASKKLSTNLIDYSPTHIKKVFTNKGHASKQRMIYYASNIIGEDIIDDNEADAIGILYTFLSSKK